MSYPTLDTKTGSAPASVRRRRATDRASRRITVIDDSQEFVELVRDVFGEEFHVSSLRMVESVNSIADTQPDLLIVDVSPDDLGRLGDSGAQLTGREVVALTRHHKRLRYVPIVACTTDVSAVVQEVEHPSAYRRMHLLTKPFELEVMEQVVRRLLGDAGPTVLKPA